MLVNKEKTSTPLAWALLQCSIRNESLRFSGSNEGTVKHLVKDHECSFQGKTAIIKGEHVQYRFEISNEKNSTTTLELTGESGEKRNQIIHWENDSLFWLEEEYDEDSTLVYFFRKSMQ